MMNCDNKRTMDSARDVLVGVIPDPKGQVEQITAALVYRYLDELDQKSVAAGGKRSFFTGKDAKYSWQKLLSTSILGDQRLTLYRDAMESMADNNKLPQVFRDMLRGMHSPFRDARVLMLFLNEINQLDCEHTEDLGDAYEHLLSIMGTQGNAGQFRTPRHIIDFIVGVMRPQIGERVLDPACGSAGFLVSAYNFIMRQNTGKKHGDKLTQSQKQKLPKNIEGRDIDPGMTRLALVNLYLHGIKEPQVREYDSLSDDSLWEERHDVILANPPFMTPKGGIQPHRKFAINANRAEVLFVDYIAEHISRTGRAGIIVPEGIIFQVGNAYKDLRKLLVNEWGLFAVVSLPAGVFQPYSGVKTSILFLDKTKRQNKNILFVKVQNDGFDLGAKRMPIDKNDLPAALQIINSYEGEKKINNSMVLSVVKTKIVEGDDFDLRSNQYLSVAEHSNKFPMVALGDILDYEQPQKYIVESTNYKNEYNIPVLTAGKTFVLGYTNEENGVFNKNLPVIIFDDFTTATKYVNFAFKVKSGAMKILHAKKELANVKYVFYMMQKIKFAHDIHKRYWIAEYSKVKIPLPPLEIQEEIVAEIDGYAKVRDGAKAVVDNWKPIINIDSDWDTVKLGDVVIDMKDGGTPSRRNKEYFGGDINWAIVKDISPKIFSTKETLSELGLKNSSAKVWAVDSIIISLGATIGNVGIAKIPLATKQGLSGIVVDKNKILVEFLYYVLCYKKEFIKSLATGSTIKEVRPPKLQKLLEIPLPPIKVQEKIVSDIESEQQGVNACRMMVDKMDAKIAATIVRIWEK